MAPAAPLIPATLLAILSLSTAYRPWPSTHPNATNLALASSKKFEGSSDFVHLRYHMGPVLTNNITVHIIWYGTWQKPQKKIIREFISSISASPASDPTRRRSTVAGWKTVQLHTDQTGSNISRSVSLGQEKKDRFYSHGKSLTRLSIQSVI
ncbi:unnamed protein product [Linum trigynum]|uniref:Uncharacterized protein n=1 Tax=Linum trigynum TaxID=586398 RepID=A0AAV2E6A3_9ROSI